MKIMPCLFLYYDVMYREGAEGKEEAYLKLCDGPDWKCFCVRLNHTDMEYLRKNWSGKKTSARYWRKDTINIWGSIPMLSVPLCRQTKLSWEEDLSIIPVKKTGYAARWDGSGSSRGNTALCHGENGHIQNA